MKPSALTKLTIAHLRGSVESFDLMFDKDKRLTILYGENGTGKSTICDALEFLSKGNVGSLDNRGLGRTNKYWNTVGKTAADVSVTLETTTATCHARIVRGNVVAQPTDARPRVEVLRRSQILDLIEARPADRYAAISRFIDVSGIEAAENTLRNLIRELNNGRDIAAARIGENLGTIQQFWETAGMPGTNAMSWAEAEGQRDHHGDDPELDALHSLQAAYSRLADYPERLPKIQESLRLARNAATAAQKLVEEHLQDIAQDAGEVMGVLTSAQAYLSKHPDATVCPLCESADATYNLTHRINQRLRAFSAFQQTQAEHKRADDHMRRAEQQQDLFYEQARQAAAAFEDVRAQFAWSSDVRLPTTSAPQHVEALSSWLTATADVLEQWQQAIAAKQDQRKFLTTLKSALKAYEENIEGQKDLDTLLPNLQRTLEIVEEQRKTFTDTALGKIASEVGRMYEEVHPGEGLNKISLELDATRRASLEIGTNFGGQSSSPPQAYFSQSHLDTLGICVFMALATLDEPLDTILVLDDVLASVDEPHVDRLVDMLYNEVTKFRHCVITTHYRPWKEKYRWGRLGHKKCHFVELDKWSNSGGMKRVKSVPEIERLRILLAESPPDPQLVCAKAGVILEAALDFLTQLYECSVPRRKDNRYVINDLLPAVKGTLRSTLRIDMQVDRDGNGKPIYQSIMLEPIFKDLEKIVQARNTMGCHFNEIAHALPEGDALSFGQKVLELIEALTDPEAGWPEKSKSGSYWANAGETRRLHPLKKPQ